MSTNPDIHSIQPHGEYGGKKLSRREVIRQRFWTREEIAKDEEQREKNVQNDIKMLGELADIFKELETDGLIAQIVIEYKTNGYSSDLGRVAFFSQEKICVTPETLVSELQRIFTQEKESIVNPSINPEFKFSKVEFVQNDSQLETKPDQKREKIIVSIQKLQAAFKKFFLVDLDFALEAKVTWHSRSGEKFDQIEKVTQIRQFDEFIREFCTSDYETFQIVYFGSKDKRSAQEFFDRHHKTDDQKRNLIREEDWSEVDNYLHREGIYDVAEGLLPREWRDIIKEVYSKDFLSDSLLEQKLVQLLPDDFQVTENYKDQIIDIIQKLFKD